MNKVLTIENIRNAKRQTLEKKNSGWIRTGARSSRLAKQFLKFLPFRDHVVLIVFFNGDRMGDIYIYIWYVYRWRYIWVSICIYLLFMRRLYIYTSILDIYAYAKKEESTDRFAQLISGEICRMVTALQKFKPVFEQMAAEKTNVLLRRWNRLSSAWAAWGAGLSPWKCRCQMGFSGKVIRKWKFCSRERLSEGFS